MMTMLMMMVMVTMTMAITMTMTMTMMMIMKMIMITIGNDLSDDGHGDNYGNETLRHVSNTSPQASPRYPTRVQVHGVHADFAVVVQIDVSGREPGVGRSPGLAHVKRDPELPVVRHVLAALGRRVDLLVLVE